MGEGSRRFLLKVWRGPGTNASWHATLRDVTDGSVHEFEATEALIDYLTRLDEAERPLGLPQDEDPLA